MFFNFFLFYTYPFVFGLVNLCVFLMKKKGYFSLKIRIVFYLCMLLLESSSILKTSVCTLLLWVHIVTAVYFLLIQKSGSSKQIFFHDSYHCKSVPIDVDETQKNNKSVLAWAFESLLMFFNCSNKYNFLRK